MHLATEKHTGPNMKASKRPLRYPPFLNVTSRGWCDERETGSYAQFSVLLLQNVQYKKIIQNQLDIHFVFIVNQWMLFKIVAIDFICYNSAAILGKERGGQGREPFKTI